MRTVRRALIALLCGLPLVVVAQSPAGDGKTAHLRIRAVGGFLGQAVGFPEYPGGPEDSFKDLKPLGGSLGVIDWLARHPRGEANLDDWLIIAPNNQTSDFPIRVRQARAAKATLQMSRLRPTSIQATVSTADTVDWFWSDIARMSPDVVALGADDFIRSLRVKSATGQSTNKATSKIQPAADFVDWLRGVGLPFLASNVVIRLHRPGLNTPGHGPIHWTVEDDSSLSWIAPITLTLPCSATIAASLDEAVPGAATAPTPIAMSLGDKPDKCDDTYEAKLQLGAHRALRPGRVYRITITGSISQTLSFQTDALLTSPWKGRDLPYALRCTTVGKPDSCGSSIVMALVDPAVKSALGADAWTYEARDGSVREKREIVFLDAVKVVQALLAEVNDAGAPPLVTVVSSLEDESMLALLKKVPQVRAVVLPQDSAMIGRAWPQVDKTDTAPAFSGDLGSAGVLDEGAVGSQKFVIRPEWFGETIGAIEADAVRVTSSGQTYWHVQADPAVDACRQDSSLVRSNTGPPHRAADTCNVEGWELKHDTKKAPGDVSYTAYSKIGDAIREVPIAVEKAYSHAFGTLWTSDDDKLVAAMAMAIRSVGDSELAVLPKNAVDDDYLAWIAREMKGATDDWLSRYMVERVLYQSPRMVRGYVTGEDLMSTLKKIIDAEGDAGVCIVGMTGSCTTELDADHPERATVNGRRIDPRLTYGIALPDRIAEALEITHSEQDPLFDAISGVERGFQAYEAGKGNHAPASPADVRRYGGYWLLSPLQLGYSKVDVHDPGDSKVRSTLPIDFKDAKPTRGFSTKITSDVALVDAPRWAIRVPGSLDYQWNKDLTPGAVHPISHDTDEFSIGLRADWKLHVLQEMRVYGGWSIDGQVSASERDVAPSFDFKTPEGLDATAAAGFKIPVTSPPSRYRGWGVGFDIVPTKSLTLWKGADITLTSGGANVIWGTSSNVLTGVSIAGEPQPTDKLAIDKGLDGLFNDYFDKNRSTFNGDTPIDFHREPVEQTRGQFDGAGELHTTIVKHKLTWTPLVRYRVYSRAKSSAASPLDLDWTLKLSLGLKLPLWSNLAVEPMIQKDWARIQAATDNLFSQLKFEIKVDVPLFMKWGKDGFIR